MASTILYKFRSGTSFEPLPLPGTSARLLDVKRAIVRAKGLDSSSSGTSLEFDLAVRNATTDEVYDDEGAILPRGTRIVVRRVAAERGRGLLSRMAQGGGAAAAIGRAPSGEIGGSAARDGFYTIRSRDRDADNEFLDAGPPPQSAAPRGPVDEGRELEALRAVTDQAGSVFGSKSAGSMPSTRVAGQGPPHFAKPPPMMMHPNIRHRPNADPELRQQEMMAMPQPKKRATGIPRTFLNLGAPSAPTMAEGGEAVEDNTATQGDLAAQLQPSAQAFQALVNRSGGQSLSSASGRRDLEYALKLTATSIPDHLQCGICHGIVKNAMLVPWDTEGRPTCESCIRDGLTKNGFTCPLTGTEGVSPDDLFPNVGLRKAADAFVKSIMEKMDSIERQIEAEEEEAKKRTFVDRNISNDVFEESGDGIMSKKSKFDNGKKLKKSQDDLLFGGEDEFGGDVFDVAGDEPEETDDPDNESTIIEPKKDANPPSKSSAAAIVDNSKKEDGNAASSPKLDNGKVAAPKVDNGGKNVANRDQQNSNANSHSQNETAADQGKTACKGGGSGTPSLPKTDKLKTNNGLNSSSFARVVHKVEAPKRRGPPAGYVLGPAGGGGGMVGGVSNMITSPTVVLPPPPPSMMMGGPPPGRGLPGPGLGPPFVDIGRGGGRGPPSGPLGGPPGGGRFYPNQFGGRGGGGRFPNQPPYPPHHNGGRGPPPEGYPNQGGRGGFNRGQPWGNGGGNDWSRKRPHDSMMDQGGPQNMRPGGPSGQGGYSQGGWGPGAPPPPGGGRGYDPRFHGGRGGGRFPPPGRGGYGSRGPEFFGGRVGWGGRGGRY